MSLKSLIRLGFLISLTAAWGPPSFATCAPWLTSNVDPFVFDPPETFNPNDAIEVERVLSVLTPDIYADNVVPTVIIDRALRDTAFEKRLTQKLEELRPARSSTYSLISMTLKSTRTRLAARPE